MDNNSSKIEALIIYEITGKITKDEQKALNSLRDQYPKVMKHSASLHEKLDNLSIPEPKDIKSIIGSITDKKIHEYTDIPGKSKKTFLKLAIPAVAACAAAIIILSKPDDTKKTTPVASIQSAKTTGVNNKKPITLSLLTAKQTINGDSLKVNKNGGITTSEGAVFNTTGLIEEDTASIYVPPGGRYKLRLSDGTSITLNSKSRVTFFRKLDNTRTIKIQGEAYIEVATDAAKPFFVYAGNTKTEVLGTAFNINSDNTGKVIVSLTRGKVNVVAYDRRVSIAPGNAATYSNGAFTVAPFDKDSVLNWTNGKIYIQCQNSQEVEDAVAKYLSFKVKFERPLSQQQAYIKIKFNQPASEFLEQFSGEYKIDSSNNIYYLK